ncbi:hypothetical protein [Streptomyces sp. SID3343]|uniref:hypothetical protein n=1 Tax=Streptomyces sp. SID3343 TaxID=2690260 RepID=UPI00136FF8E8|nr:hypothetical protein [Streptomyces sp. SID3343]
MPGASDDSDAMLFPVVDPLPQVEPRKAPNGKTVAGPVTSLGALPPTSACPGALADCETEGDDYDRHTGVPRVDPTESAGHPRHRLPSCFVAGNG